MSFTPGQQIHQMESFDWNNVPLNGSNECDEMEQELKKENLDFLNGNYQPMANYNVGRPFPEDGNFSHTPSDRPFLMNDFNGGSESLSSYSSPINKVAGPTQANIAAMNKQESDSSLASNSIIEERPKKGKSKTKRQVLDDQDAILMARDDSELTEKELAQKKKAQNRAAQRAFRERKETKLKTLESKLLESEEVRQKLLDQLEQIKEENISIRTENQLLRSNGDVSTHPQDVKSTSNKFAFPLDQQEFINGIVQGLNHVLDQGTINKVYENPENPGKKVLAIGATWDYLQIKAEEEEYENRLDVYEVMQKLKGKERCHGYGPAYPLELIESVIKEVSSS